MKAVVTSGERGPMVRWFAPNFLSNGVAKSPTVINTLIPTLEKIYCWPKAPVDTKT